MNQLEPIIGWSRLGGVGSTNFYASSWTYCLHGILVVNLEMYAHTNEAVVQFKPS